MNGDANTMKKLFSLVFALLMTFAVCFALARPFEDTVKADVTYMVWNSDHTYNSNGPSFPVQD